MLTFETASTSGHPFEPHAHLLKPDIGRVALVAPVRQGGGSSFLAAVKGSYRHENTERMAASSLPTPELAAQYADWLDTFRDHSKVRDAENWAMADLIAEARRKGIAASTSQLADVLDVARVKFSNSVRIATAFPPGTRDERLSFEVHAQLSCLPDETRFETLATAAAESWGERRAKAAAVAYRQERAGFVEDDPEVTLAVHVMRAWNRATPEAREYFNGLREIAGLGIIDEDA